jgi:hypothetical protein
LPENETARHAARRPLTQPLMLIHAESGLARLPLNVNEKQNDIDELFFSA